MFTCSFCGIYFWTGDSLIVHQRQECSRNLFGEMRIMDYYPVIKAKLDNLDAIQAQLRVTPKYPLLCEGNQYTLLTSSQQATIAQRLPEYRTIPDRSNRAALRAFFNPAPTTFCAPKPELLVPKRTAVVIDCEMAGTQHGQALIKLSAVDFLTGLTLIDALVNPEEPITHWRTWVTGITNALMKKKVAMGATLDGTEGARQKLWDFVDEDTILIGHAVSNDLKALQVSHANIIDTSLLTSGPPPPNSSRRYGQVTGLKRLCEEFVGIRIRNSSAHASHSSLEDVLATRELLLWCLNHPEKVAPR